jgi:hypothetical protein
MLSWREKIQSQIMGETKKSIYYENGAIGFIHLEDWAV